MCGSGQFAPTSPMITMLCRRRHIPVGRGYLKFESVNDGLSPSVGLQSESLEGSFTGKLKCWLRNESSMTGSSGSHRPDTPENEHGKIQPAKGTQEVIENKATGIYVRKN